MPGALKRTIKRIKSRPSNKDIARRKKKKKKKNKKK